MAVLGNGSMSGLRVIELTENALFRGREGFKILLNDII